MNFYSILFIHLKILSKSKLHILTKLLLKSRSFNSKNFVKLVEINKYETIRSNFLSKEKLLEWYLIEFSNKKVSTRNKLSNWIRLLKILQLKKKVFYNESSKIKTKTKIKTVFKKKK